MTPRQEKIFNQTKLRNLKRKCTKCIEITKSKKQSI